MPEESTPNNQTISKQWPVFEIPGNKIDTSTLETEKAAILNLLKATDLGVKTVWKLSEQFSSARSALTASDYTLESVGGLKPDSIRGIREAVGDGFGETQLENARKLGGRILIAGEDEYPPLLANAASPPAVLFAIGKPLPSNGKAVAVVGRRKANEPGLELAHQISAGLTKAGLCVVSGMAYGIDAAAHRGSIQEGGPTVAVLGCGIDLVYPKQHRKLRDEIIRNGTVVSELFMGSSPEARNFPMRNRIIAWMSLGTVVIEANAKSGSLITASYALQENREVFAVPGHPLSPGHEGTNHLLKHGAALTRHAGDVIEILAQLLGIDGDAISQGELLLDASPDGLEDEELRVYTTLDPVEKIHADSLSEKLELDTSRLSVLLLSMELKGVVKRLPGDHYIRVVVKKI